MGSSAERSKETPTKKRWLPPVIILAGLVGVVFLTFFLIKYKMIRINSLFLGEDPVIGVDVSKYQGEIDMDAIASQGMSFIYIKATEGTSHVDAFFAKNWENARKTPMLAGAYHFFSFESGGDTQAENYIQTVGDLNGDLIPVVDVEHYGDTASNPPDKETVIKELKVFLTKLEEHYGVKPMIYTDKRFYGTYMAGSVDGYPLWLRNVYFPLNWEFEEPWTMWQYSDHGKLDGYHGEESFIDMNVLNPEKKLVDITVKGEV